MKSQLIHTIYTRIAKPVFFRMDPERVHDRAVATGERLGRHQLTQQLTRYAFNYQHESLQQEIRGIVFKNPIGLAAGFDKNAQLTQILPAVGFGHMEVGSVTGEPCPGNSGRRLWRLPQSQSLVVYYGLKNDGCEEIAKRLANQQFEIPLGVSIAKTNSPDTVTCEAGIEDYVKAYRVMTEAKIGDYVTINISCPNAFGGEPFSDPQKLNLLLKEISQLPKTRPIFIKLAADLTTEVIDQIIDLARTYRIDGFIATNLAKDRSNSAIKETSVPDKGGLSGKVVESLSNNMISYIYSRIDTNEFVIIGCGGVFSAEDAYEKIKRGASLIQMITGMIYEGPQVIGQINRGLAELVRRDGYSHISQAVGSAHR